MNYLDYLKVWIHTFNMKGKEHKLTGSKIKVGERGQITIPKNIRLEDKITSKDTLRVTHLPGGSIVIRKIEKEKPEDRIMKIIMGAPKIDIKKAWKEVQKERDAER